jgi:hypothetical protein
MLRTPSNAGGSIVRRIVWPIRRSSIHERQMPSIQRSRWITFRLLSVFLTASKDFFQTFDENIRWFDARPVLFKGVQLYKKGVHLMNELYNCTTLTDSVQFIKDDCTSILMGGNTNKCGTVFFL